VATHTPVNTSATNNQLSHHFGAYSAIWLVVLVTFQYQRNSAISARASSTSAVHRITLNAVSTSKYVFSASNEDKLQHVCVRKPDEETTESDILEHFTANGIQVREVTVTKFIKN
jgi:hypothetical protein